MARSAAEIQADIDTLREFADAYRLYYTVPDNEGVIPLTEMDRDGLRRRIHRMLGRAEAAMEAAGVNAFGVDPPPAIGGQGRRGLVATAFAYDEPQFQGDPPVYQLVLDRLELAVGVLENESAGSPGTRPAPVPPPAESRGGRHRFPRLLLERVGETVPRWAVGIERLVLFLAAVAAIVATIGLLAGWWTS